MKNNITIHTEATIAAEGKFNSKHCTPIMCIKQDGSELRSFTSVWDAARELGINAGYISTCMNKDKEVPCKGYIFFHTKEAASFIGIIVDSFNRNAQDANKYRRIKAQEEAARLEKERKANEIVAAQVKLAKLNAEYGKYETKLNNVRNARDAARRALDALLQEKEQEERECENA